MQILYASKVNEFVAVLQYKLLQYYYSRVVTAIRSNMVWTASDLQEKRLFALVSFLQEWCKTCKGCKTCNNCASYLQAILTYLRARLAKILQESCKKRILHKNL